MPKPIVVLMNWNDMTPTEMASFAHNIAAKMPLAQAKLTAADPPPITPAEMDAAANRLEMAYANRMNGAVAKTEFENADTALDELLHVQAAFVNIAANGNKLIIEAFGFTATTDSRKKAVVPATPNAAKFSGNAGALHLLIDAVPGATSYCWVIFTSGATNATVTNTHIVLSGAAIIIPDGGARETLRGVIPAGTVVSVQVLAQNAAGKSSFSPMITFTIGS